MNQSLFIGVDGGASKCIVRVEDEAGKLLGVGQSGPANIRLSVPGAWESLLTAMSQAMAQAGISLSNETIQLHAGVGIAGSEIKEAYQRFVESPHPFKTLNVISDAHAACLGAHKGEDGAIIIIGTGVVGFQLENGETSQVGGYGFPYDDEGSGAWLGLLAIRETLQSLDGRAPPGALTQAIASRFNHDLLQIANWANQATTTDYASLAPEIVKYSEQGDPFAMTLLQQAAECIDKIGARLNPSLPCALIGGLVPFIQPHLGEALQSRLRANYETPEQGAIRLIKKLRNA